MKILTEKDLKEMLNTHSTEEEPSTMTEKETLIIKNLSWEMANNVCGYLFLKVQINHATTKYQS